MVIMSIDKEIRYLSKKEVACELIERSIENGRKMLAACGRQRRPDQLLDQRFEIIQDAMTDMMHLAVAECLHPVALFVEAYSDFLDDENEAEADGHDALYRGENLSLKDVE